MNIYLVSSPELDETFYRSVVDFLKSFSGPINFFAAEDLILLLEDKDMLICASYAYRVSEPKYLPTSKTKRKGEDVVAWAELFDECTKYREEYIIEENDYLFLLTDRPNENNWFSAFDKNNTRNGFIHTADWEKFIYSDALYPVAYEAATGPFHSLLIENYKHLDQNTHLDTIGCMNDYCKDKKDIALKLRTGDICHTCLERLEWKGIDPTVIEQVLNILEGIRKQVLFHNNFSIGKRLSGLVINRYGNIVLPDYGNRIVNLTPLEKTLYIFYLRHKTGCRYADLIDHEGELLAIYSKLSHSGSKEEIRENTRRMVDMRENSVREKVSKIKRAFVKTLGNRLAEHYYIKTLPNQVHGILLDRKNVSYEMDFS